MGVLMTSTRDLALTILQKTYGYRSFRGEQAEIDEVIHTLQSGILAAGPVVGRLEAVMPGVTRPEAVDACVTWREAVDACVTWREAVIPSLGR